MYIVVPNQYIVLCNMLMLLFSKQVYYIFEFTKCEVYYI